MDTNPHLKEFEGIFFEIQVKSVLDFAWDVIEHDRNYKPIPEYPEGSNIPRRFYLMSGLLEIADNELECLSQQAAMYDNSLLKKIEEGRHIEISPHSLRLYLTKKFGDIYPTATVLRQIPLGPNFETPIAWPVLRIH